MDDRGPWDQGAAGVKLNLGSGRHPLDGFENLNEPGHEWPAIEWTAPLLPYEAESIEAVTISHLLMYLELPVIFELLREVRRVLARAYPIIDIDRMARGVVRITEDETWGPYTGRPGVQPGACTATSEYLLAGLLVQSGFGAAQHVQPDATRYRDGSLIQQWHGDPPNVFHVEAYKC